MKQTIYYMAVQVVSRYPDGKLHQWYDGEQRATLQEAKDEAQSLAAEFKGAPFQVIERRMLEIGREVVKRK